MATKKFMKDNLPGQYRAVIETFGETAWDQLSQEQLYISDSEIKFFFRDNRYQYNLKVAKDAKTFQVDVLTKNDSMAIQFTVHDENQIIAKLPLTGIGPRVIVLRKEKTVAKRNASLAKVKGKWKLNARLTQALIKQQLSGPARKKYSEDLLSSVNEVGAMEFSSEQVNYSGEKRISYLRQAITVGNTLRIEPKHSYSPYSDEIIVTLINDDLILLWDSARMIYAIYGRQLDDKDREIDEANSIDLPAITAAVNSLDSYLWPVREELPDRAESIGVSGRVELEEVEVQRRRASGAAKSADITNTTLKFFLNVQGKLTPTRGPFMIKLVKLNQVVDDKGRRLLTDKRFKRCDVIQRYVKSRETGGKRDGRSGPYVYVTLDAPALGATQISEVSGEFVVRPFSIEWVKFEDLRSRVGEKLVHPLLKDQSVVPTINDADRSIEMEIEESPIQRVFSWHVTDSSEDFPLDPISIAGDMPYVEQGFLKRIPQKLDLWVGIKRLQSPQKLPFKFKDIRFADFQLK